MNRQNEIIREITFPKQDTLILVPPDMLAQVITCCQKEPAPVFALDEFFPPDLMKYLEQVLETNRHLPLFSSVLPKELPDGCGVMPSDEVFSLILTQLSGLRIDRRLWFSRLEYAQTPGRGNLLLTEYTQEAREIGRKGGVFLYGKNGYQKGRTACILDPAP